MVCVALNRAGNLVPLASWILREMVGCDVSISGSGTEADAAGAAAATGAAAVLLEAPGVGLPSL